MHSPFPGMDPYLEGPQWMSVHTELSVEMARQLAPRLPARYVVRTTERVVVAMPDTVEGEPSSVAGIYPDAFVADTGVKAAPAPASSNGGGVAVAPPLRVATVMPESIPHVTVEVRDAADRRLVSAIEVLSPTNKRPEGREEYLAKRRRILLSSVHLIEIDLLRSGQRVPMLQALPPLPYFVFVGRAEKRPITDVWPVRLEDPLPTIPVPLLPGDADVTLDLQQALTTVYDTFRYDRSTDYTIPPAVPLRPPEWAAYAAERVRAWRSSHGQQ